MIFCDFHLLWWFRQGRKETAKMFIIAALTKILAEKWVKYCFVIYLVILGYKIVKLCRTLQRKVYLFDFKTCRHLFKKYLNFYILLNVCPGRPRSRTTLSWGRPARRRCRRSRRVLGNKVSFYCFVYLPNWNFIFLDEDDGSSVLPEPCDTSKIRADKYFLPFELGKWGDS